MPQHRVPDRTALLVASGDLRDSANEACWPAQRGLEQQAAAAFEALGWRLLRAHPAPDGIDLWDGAGFDHSTEGTAGLHHLGPPGMESWGTEHGFISSQAMGREVFARIDPRAPLVVAEAVWQYSHHVLIGLLRHEGPVLILANWSGRWPGLVGAMNLRGSLSKAGIGYSMLWSEDFSEERFRAKLRQWLDTGRIEHDLSHVRPLDGARLPEAERRLGESLAEELRARPAIMGVFDEGCMGMFNAIIPDALLNRAGVFKERLSQSALYYAMTRVPDEEADGARRWLDGRGMRFNTGGDEATELTDRQVREQLKMYIAAARIADGFGCDCIGIQYQQGLKDLCPASDLAEGLLNCSDRPPVARAGGTGFQPVASPEIIRPGRPITHFNEVDECAGLDALITERVWTAMGLEPDNTLHDLRWGDWWDGSPSRLSEQQGGAESRPTDAGSESRPTYVWVLEISGAVPPSHLAGGYAGAVSQRQPPMYFRLGGGTIKGVSKPGEVVWSRIFVEGDRLHMDLGRCRAVELPPEETQRRWESTTPQWPIMHAVLYGVDRDQMMARHRANHIQVVYAPDAETADRALAAKAAMAHAMGIDVHLCGSARDGTPLPQRLVGL